MTGLSQIYNSEDSKKSLIASLERYGDFILKESLTSLWCSFGLKLVAGLEIELYLKSVNQEVEVDKDLLKDIIAGINCRCGNVFDSFLVAESERGFNQIEIKTIATSNIDGLLKEVGLILGEVNGYLKERYISAIYKARPYDYDCANALQLNLSLKSNSSDNVFANYPELMSKISDYLIRYLDETLIFSSSKGEDFVRYDVEYNKSIFKQGKFVAPTYKSWGYDNRTCAVRVVKSTEDIHDSRIELRTPSNSANLELLTAAIAIIIDKFYQDIAGYQSINKAVYGNSFDSNYELQKISSSYLQAVEDFFASPSLIMQKMKNILQSNSLF